MSEYQARFETVDSVAHEDGAFRLRVGEAGDVGVIVGAPTDDIDESIDTLRRSLLVVIPFVVGALAALLWWLVGRTLRPVEAIRAEVAEIGGRDLDRRVPVPPGDDEVARLARTMNDMLERVDGAAQRQRRFVADASHELRSPLTRIRTELEVDLAHPADAELLATHASVLDETIGLQRLADDLLIVAALDEVSARLLRHEAVDLDDIVLRVGPPAARRRARAGRHQRRSAPAASSGTPTCSPGSSGTSPTTPSATRRRSVVLTLAEHDEQVVLTVEDDGPGVPPADRERIFERFARVDSARSTDAGGTGLGLAIARDIAEAHRGNLVLDPTSAGARFVLTLPAMHQLTAEGLRPRRGGELVADVGEGLHPLLRLVGTLEHPLAFDHEGGDGHDPVVVGLGSLGVHELGLGIGREQRRGLRGDRGRRRPRAWPARSGRRRRARR